MKTPVDTEVQVVGVADYAERINSALRHAGSAVVEGEVQDLRQLKSGVLSFTLTDGAQKLPCRHLPWLNRHQPPTHSPSEGDQVRVHARHVEWWGPGGLANVVLTDITLAGEGELLRARERLIAKLGEESLCDPRGFPALPRFPRAVGVIAGRDSDALADVLRGLADRFPAVPVFTCCCRVQGAGAVAQVKEALIALHHAPLVDVIVIARGGGSVQELAAFDDEGLCRAIRALGTPVVTAIGHTDNNPVCNHVTHAAFVPRHAAERVVCDRRDLLRDVGEAGAAMERAVTGLRQALVDFEGMSSHLHGRVRLGAWRGHVLECGQVIDSRAEEFLADGRTLLAAFPGAAQRAVVRPRALRAEVEDAGGRLWQAARRMLDAERDDMDRSLLRQLENQRQVAARIVSGSWGDLDRAASDLKRSADRQRDGMARDVAGLAAVLDAADFRRQGWMLAADASGKAVGSSEDLRPGDELMLYLRDGVAQAVVSEVKPDHLEGAT